MTVPKWRAEMRKRQTAARKSVAPYRDSGGAHHRVTVPAHVLAERDRRLAAGARSLTAILCGDPGLGRSALERRGE